MEYFKLLSLILGALIVIKVWAIQRYIKKCTEEQAGKWYPEKRAIWMYAAVVVQCVVIVYTWFQQLVAPIPYSLLVALLVTVPVYKIWEFYFRYATFRQWAIRVVAKDKALLRKYTLIGGAGGVLLLFLGVFVY